jgi:hypothetical protein
VTARVVHVPSDAIAAADPGWGAALLGDQAHSLVFDNSKLRSVVPGWRAAIPFERGAREIASWYTEDASRQAADPRLNALMDKLAETHQVSTVAGYRLLTRDVRGYRTHFPTIDIIAPVPAGDDGP